MGNDSKFSVPFELLSSGLIKSGRRTMRMGTELMIAIVPFSFQRRLCKYEQMAFGDRAAALAKRRDAKNHQDSLRDIKIGLKETEHHAEVIGMTLQLEVARLSEIREKDWS